MAQNMIPEFRITGVDGLNALAFEPDEWPRPEGHDDTATIMRVVHLTTGLGRYIRLEDIDGLADWFERGPREKEINDPGGTGVLMHDGTGYADVYVWRHGYSRAMRDNRAWRVTLDPSGMISVVEFLREIRRTGWTTWNGGR